MLLYLGCIKQLFDDRRGSSSSVSDASETEATEASEALQIARFK